MTEKQKLGRKLIRVAVYSQLLTEEIDDLREIDFKTSTKQIKKASSLFDKVALRKVSNQALLANADIQKNLRNVSEEMFDEFTRAFEFYVKQISDNDLESIVLSYQKEIEKLNEKSDKKDSSAK